MIRAWEVRIVCGGILLAGLGGCHPASSGTSKAPPNLNINAPAQPAPSNPEQPPSQPVRQQAIEYFGNFRKALAEGKAGADMLTPAFRKKAARPKYKDEQHEKLGYDPQKLEALLQRAVAARFDGIEGISGSAATYFVSLSKEAGKGESCLVRLVPSKEPAGWQVDWLECTSTIAPPYRDPALGPQQADARIAAIGFLSALLDGQFDLAEGWMSKVYKEDLAFSTTDSNKDLGYDPVMLHTFKLRDWKENFKQFTIERQEIKDGWPAIFGGELADVAGKVRKTFTLILTKTDNGDWQINKFEAK